MASRSLKVAVIGAGMAGLVAANELRTEGHRVVVFEKSNKLGGIWLYDPRVESDPLGVDPKREIVHSSLYRSLRVNLPRQLMGFMKYPFVKREGGDPRSFPGHEEVLSYLNDFAREFDLVGLIRFGREVVRIERVDGRSEMWVVEWQSRIAESGRETNVEVFEAVVICNGKYTEPRIAEFPGMTSWPRVQIHCHNYRTPEPFQDQIVILIGDGPSAFDVCREISIVAKEVHIASRHPDFNLAKLYNQDNIWQHSMIECACEDGKVEFQDGSSVYADAIMHCTGYKYHFPFLRTNGIVSVDDNRVGPLYKHVFPPCLAPRLSFVGIPYMTIGFILCELQSKWVAKVLSGKVPLPTEESMVTSVQEMYQHMEEIGQPKHHTHDLHYEQLEYENWLADQAGSPSIENWRKQMFLNLFKIYISCGAEFRERWEPEEWIQEYESSVGTLLN